MRVYTSGVPGGVDVLQLIAINRRMVVMSGIDFNVLPSDGVMWMCDVITGEYA